jgi:3-oxoacyl-(acyl-carrier-protein) synthase
MNIYIQAAAQISAQDPIGNAWFQHPLRFTERYVRSIDPDFKEYINPMEARRMGKILKRALATSLHVVRKTGIDQPDAIITGTGLGCIENTEKFLTAMVRYNEMYLQPTYFMQSTHNTISSQIALHLKCNKYNTTYAQRGISFESSLLDAYMQFELGKIKSALVAGHDEMTPDYFVLLDKINYWKTGEVNEAVLRKSDSVGSFAGEASACFMLENKKTDFSICELKGVDLFFNPSPLRMKEAIEALLSKHNLHINDIDVVLTGINGDKDNDVVYNQFQQHFFPETPMAWYKHLFGESFTACGLGMFTAATALQEQLLPVDYLFNRELPLNGIKNILIYNHFQNKDHALILLSSC